MWPRTATKALLRRDAATCDCRTVGNGKHLPYIEQAMERMGIGDSGQSGADSRRLASLIAASVLAGELSLLAAQTNPGELMQAHVAYERPQTQA